MYEKLDKIRESERKVFAAEHRSRAMFSVLVALSGALLGMAVLYLTDIVLQASEAGYYNFSLEMDRRPIVNFLTFSAPGVLAGGLLGGLLTYFVGSFRTSGFILWHWILIAAIFGTVLPFLIGVIHLFSDVLTLYATGGTLPVGLNLALSGAFFDTPRFIYVFGLSGLYAGWLSSVILGVSAWIAQLGAQSQYGRFTVVRLSFFLLPIILALAALLVVLFSPLSFFKEIVESLGGIDVAN